MYDIYHAKNFVTVNFVKKDLGKERLYGPNFHNAGIFPNISSEFQLISLIILFW